MRHVLSSQVESQSAGSSKRRRLLMTSTLWIVQGGSRSCFWSLAA
jgi:hypothetical protein